MPRDAPTGGLAHGTCIWTPKGFSHIETLRVGDAVIGGDGKPCRVITAFTVARQQCLMLGFDRGVTIKCASKQPWLVLHPAARFPTRHSHGKVEPNPRFDRWEVLETQTIFATSGTFSRPRRRFLIPATEAVQMDAQEVPLDPYLLGVLLGDGCLRNGCTFLSTSDHEIVESVAAALPNGVEIRHLGRYDYGLVVSGGKGHGQGGGFAGRGNPLTNLLRGLGVHGALSADKFVPERYLFNLPAVRLAILQGLLDTDGGIAPTQGAIEFSSTSPYLASAIEYLVASFGGKSVTSRRITRFTDKYGQKKDGAESFRIRIRLPQVVPFRLGRKVERLVRPVSTCDERVLWSMEEAGTADCTAIEVDSASHTFLVDKGVVAHDCTIPLDRSDVPGSQLVPRAMRA